MKLEEIKKTAVIGVGLMGSQIAEILARLGEYEVRMVDINDELVEWGFKTIEDRLERFFVAKGRMTAKEKEEILGRLRLGTSIEETVKEVDFVVEVVAENMEIKKDIYRRLDESAPAHTILATNTSGLSITEIAATTKRPDKVVGMHFFNPIAVMKLIEVVRGAYTSDETVEVTSAMSRKIGKEPVVCRDTSYGFLANRAYGVIMNEVVQMLWERVASPEDIDKALKLGYNLPMGPLELGDMNGTWGIRAVAEEDRIRELGPEKGRLHPLLRMMVRAGYTGGAGKKGIYDFWREVLSKW